MGQVPLGNPIGDRRLSSAVRLLELKFRALKKIGGVYGSLHAKCCEPAKRNKDGVKWITHRFPIKNGISLHDVMLQDFRAPNPLLALCAVILDRSEASQPQARP